MEVTGKVVMIGGIQEISDKFKKREFVIETEDQYPQEIIIQATQDRVDILNGIVEGDEITASCNLRGRRWESKTGDLRWFISLDAWKVQKEEKGSQIEDMKPITEDIDGDLPF